MRCMASLASDLKQKGKILAAKGAIGAWGASRAWNATPSRTVVGFTFTDLYADGKHAGLILKLERAF